MLRTLGTTMRTVRSHVDRTLQQTGLRLGQFQVLRHLWGDDGLTPRELATRLDVEMPTVTRTVQRMIRDGLVDRRAHPDD
ncbi:MAG TPA: MarR family transcriptional regulator, partial [Candidatus Aquilonibacter sp.]